MNTNRKGRSYDTCNCHSRNDRLPGLGRACPWLKTNPSSGRFSMSVLPWTVTTRIVRTCTSSVTCSCIARTGDDRNKSVSPDLMVVLGASKHVRSSYRVWEEPKAPDFVLEFASASIHRIDRGARSATPTRSMGVLEYWQYDPVGSYTSIPPLLGFRLVEGRIMCRYPLWHRKGGDTLALRQARCWGWSCV